MAADKKNLEAKWSEYLEQQKRGTSVFFSSHILSDVEEICNRIAILNKGKLLCTGRLDELLACSGTSVTIAPGHDDILKELIAMAAGTEKQPDGAWVLNFGRNEEAVQRAEALSVKNPGALMISAMHENLEEFFFQTLEKDRAESGEKENGQA